MHDYELLVDKFLNKTISKQEREVLEKWILESDSNVTFFKNQIKESNYSTSLDFDSDAAYQKFNATLKSKKPKQLLQVSILKYAAVFIALMTIGFFAKRTILDTNNDSIPAVVDGEIKKSNDNNVIITLSDGSTKVLTPDDTNLITDKDGKVIANKGVNSLTFDSGTSLASNELHEIFIPYAQTFKLTLSDGTLVWLNAGSKLRFPQRFSKSSPNRTVYLDGEAFFEVTKNEKMPFIVNTHEVDIKVLGTKFNVSSYENDNFIATTLVEGSVSVYEARTPENELRLSPSYQATYSKFKNSFSRAKVDTSIYTAWMENKLIIDNMRFSDILIKLERRHHVKFVNKAESLNNEIYKGEFEGEDIESILKTIALSTPFEYEINQNIITINK